MPLRWSVGLSALLLLACADDPAATESFGDAARAVAVRVREAHQGTSVRVLNRAPDQPLPRESAPELPWAPRQALTTAGFELVTRVEDAADGLVLDFTGVER